MHYDLGCKMKNYDINLIKSRFFTYDDENTNDFLYSIPKEWWSRLYEYVWAGHFVESSDVCLDAACGTGHHLKYYLAYNCSKVYACDLDSSIMNRTDMINGIGSGFGKEAQEKVEKVYDNIDFKVANLTALPYEDKKFDKIYCISVLEHLSYDVMENSFREFHRALKDDGLIILTFDFPSINLDLLSKALKNTGFSFLGEVDFNIPENVLNSWIYSGLKCFRAVLKKI